MPHYPFQLTPFLWLIYAGFCIHFVFNSYLNGKKWEETKKALLPIVDRK